MVPSILTLIIMMIMQLLKLSVAICCEYFNASLIRTKFCKYIHCFKRLNNFEAHLAFPLMPAAGQTLSSRFKNISDSLLDSLAEQLHGS